MDAFKGNNGRVDSLIKDTKKPSTIGILTYYAVDNFGANLQALSTYCSLRKRGHNAIFINWFPDELKKIRENNPLQEAVHKEFVGAFLAETRVCKTSEDIAKVIDENAMDAVIIGSDAVLQHKRWFEKYSLSKKHIIYRHPFRKDNIFPNPFWGDFFPFLRTKIPLALMSASSQNSNYNGLDPITKSRMRKYLSRFSYLSTRDKWTQSMVAAISNGNLKVPITPDPVWGFNFNVGDRIDCREVIEKFALPEKYILISLLNTKNLPSSWFSEFEKIASKSGYICIQMATTKGLVTTGIQKSIDLPLTPIEWYSLIKNSSGYIGHLMHPIIVSLHNSVPFFSFDNYGIVKYKYLVNVQSSKIFDILSQAGFSTLQENIAGKSNVKVTPNEVFRLLVEFDHKKCSDFSELQLSRYKNMMDAILEKIL